MDEKELERRLGELRGTWRVPEDPPLERMWQVVESAAFPPYRTVPRWTVRTWLPLAAMLVLGFGIGKLTPGLTRAPEAPGAPAGVAQQAAPAQLATYQPFVGVATDYLERVTALLVALAEANRQGQPLDPNALQAKDLLATTRLLLDSPQPADPRLQALLSDLELVLAQIVRLPRSAPSPDVYLIDQALDQREVLPRLRELLAENSTSQP